MNPIPHPSTFPTGTVATRLGAFPERLRNYRAHMLVAPDAPAGAVNDALLARLHRAATLEAAAPAE